MEGKYIMYVHSFIVILILTTHWIKIVATFSQEVDFHMKKTLIHSPTILSSLIEQTIEDRTNNLLLCLIYDT